MIYSKKLIPRLAKFVFLILEKIHLLKQKDALEKKLNDALKDYQDCAKFTKNHPYVLIESFFILLFQRLSLLLVSYMIYLAFGLDAISIFEIISIQVCITLASDFVPSPGGVGVSEGLLLQVNEMIYGSILGTSAMILLRGISFYIVVLFSGIFYLFFHFIKRKGVRSI